MRIDGAELAGVNGAERESEMSYKKRAIVLMVVSIILVLGSAYVPDVFFRILSLPLYNEYRYTDIRFLQIIKSIQLCGVLLSVWGIAVFLKKEGPKRNAEEFFERALVKASPGFARIPGISHAAGRSRYRLPGPKSRRRSGRQTPLLSSSYSTAAEAISCGASGSSTQPA